MTPFRILLLISLYVMVAISRGQYMSTEHLHALNPPKANIAIYGTTPFCSLAIYGTTPFCSGTTPFCSLAVFDQLEADKAAHFYNLGTGKPHSVREVIDAVEEVTGLEVPIVEAPRRAGDPPVLFADSSGAQKELGWKIEY